MPPHAGVYDGHLQSVLFTLFQCYHQKINGCKIALLMAFLAAFKVSYQQIPEEYSQPENHSLSSAEDFLQLFSPLLYLKSLDFALKLDGASSHKKNCRTSLLKVVPLRPFIAFIYPRRIDNGLGAKKHEANKTEALLHCYRLIFFAIKKFC